MEDYDFELYSLIEKFCLEYLFNLKGKPGITFLLPPVSNKEYRKKLFSYANGDEDQKTIAEDMIKSLIINDNIKTPEMFRAKSDDIPNMLGQIIQVDNKKTTFNTIRLEGGAKLEPDKTFALLCKKNNLNIFLLLKGEIPLDAPPAKYKYVKSKTSSRKKPKETDQKDGKTDLFSIEQKKTNSTIRRKIATEVENKYISDSVIHGRIRMVNNAYISAVLSLVNYIYKYCTQDIISGVLVSRIIPMISFENIDFYIIFEPFTRDYNPDGSINLNYLVPYDIIFGWSRIKPPFDHKKTIDLIDKLMSGKNPAIFSSPLSVINAIEPFRQSIMTGHGRESTTKINQVYNGVLSKNAVDDVKDLFSPDFHRYFSENPGRKLLLDEIRYRSNLMFSMLGSSPMFDVGMYRDIIMEISDYFSSGKIKLLDPSTLKYSVDPSNKIREIRSFVNSIYFIYFPLSSSAYSSISEQYDISEEPSPDANALWIPINICHTKEFFNKKSSGKSAEKETKANAMIAAKLLREFRESNLINIDDELLHSLESIAMNSNGIRGGKAE